MINLCRTSTLSWTGLWYTREAYGLTSCLLLKMVLWSGDREHWEYQYCTEMFMPQGKAHTAHFINATGIIF